MKKYIFNSNALRVALIFLFFGFIWIYFSDRILLLFTQDIEKLREIQTIKGWWFVFITTLLIYGLVTREIKSKNKLIVRLKEAEQELLDSTERLKAISDASNEAIVFSENGICMEANAKAISLFGYSYDEFIGLKATDVIAPHYRGIVKNKIIEADEKSYEALALRKDDSTFWAEISGQKYLYKGKTMRVSIVKNIDRTKKIEQEILESEQKFNELFQHLNTGVAIYKPTGNNSNFEVVDINYTGQKLTKTKKSDIVGKKVTEAFPGIKKFGLFEVLQRVYKSGFPEKLPLKTYKDDRIEESVENYVFRLPSGLIVGLFDDTSDKEIALEKVRESEKKYKTLFTNSSSAYAYHKIITDEQGNPIDYIFLDVNPEFERQTGLKKENILNKSVKQVLPAIEDYWIQKYGEVAMTGHPINFNNYSADLGKYFEARVYSPHKGYFAVTFHDATDKIKATDALKESEQRYILATRASNLGIWDWYMAKEEVYYSDLWKEQLGYKPEELENSFKTFEKLLHPEDKERVLQKANAYVKNGGGLYEIEFRLKHKNGSYRWIYARAEALKNNKGKIYRMFGTHRDITAEKEAQLELEKYKNKLEHLVKERTDEVLMANEELNSANEELHVTNEMLENKKEKLEKALEKLKETQNQLVHSEKMASLGVLVAGIAHEINNPVNFISSGISGIRSNVDYLIELLSKKNETSKNTDQFIEESNKVAEMLKRAMGAVDAGVERTVKIVQGLKTFAYGEDNSFEEFDLNELIDNTLLILRNQFKNRIIIEKLYGKIPLVNGMVGKLNQVILNILSNAIESIEGKGTISIKTLVVNNLIVIKVKDTGHGMDEKTKSKIFDPFFTTKQVGKGTGLGLSISYNIVKEHQGQIEVNSELNKGTEFTIKLPL